MSRMAERISTMSSSVRDLKSLTNSLVREDIISFSGGAPGLEAYPMEALDEIARGLFSRDSEGYGAVKYGSTLGNLRLREAVRDQLLAPRGLDVSADNIMITAGGIQAINFMCQMFIDPGDVILVESPTFVHASMIYKMFEAGLVPCEMDDGGLIMSDVEEKIRKYHPKFIYTVPTFQNPTGLTMPESRRRELLALAERYDVMIFEDDPYREIRYSGEELPYIKSMDINGKVILAGSFSKILSPGSRLGYIVADDGYMEVFKDIKLGTDTCTNTVTQEIAARFFEKGLYADHLKTLRDMYRGRRDAMAAAIDAFFPEGTERTDPDGGFYIWVRLPGDLNAKELSEEAAEKLGICYGIGATFFSEGNPEGIGDDCIRMNFSGLTETEITKNVARLGAFFSEKLCEEKSICTEKADAASEEGCAA